MDVKGIGGEMLKSKKSESEALMVDRSEEVGVLSEVGWGREV